MDRLSALLSHFSLHASTFYSGRLCGTTAFRPQARHGYVHLLRAGRAAFRPDGAREQVLEQPSLLYLPRCDGHSLIAEEADRAELVCAALAIDGGTRNPLTQALPEHVCVPLAELPHLALPLDWLFAEAFGSTCGRTAVLNRLFELMVIQLLRHLLTQQSVSTGLLAGLADPRLSRALTALHDDPARPWSVETLAQDANMSRASFAAHFRKVVGQTPGDYLLGWRVSLAQKRLRQGRPIALIADEVGYESPSALARAFRRKVGQSPREWLQNA